VLVSPDGGRRHAQAGGGISGSGTVEGTVVERGPTYLHLVVSAWPAGVWGKRRRGDADGGSFLRFRVDRYFSDVPVLRMAEARYGAHLRPPCARPRHASHSRRACYLPNGGASARRRAPRTAHCAAAGALPPRPG
jgi:hypothetical protein